MGRARDLLRSGCGQRRRRVRYAEGCEQAGPQVARVNLPNAITAARIAVAPAIAWMIVMPSWSLRLAGWILYLAAAITDYYDGKLARSRNLVTDLGRLLDPLAD